MRNIIFTLCVLTNFGSWFSLKAQSDPKYQEVLSLFGPRESVWVNYYSGYDHRGKSFLFILGRNQNISRGFLYDLSDNSKFKLEGLYQPNSFKWLVVDTTDSVWGSANGQKQDSILKIEIYSNDKQNSLLLTLVQSDRIPHNAIPCPKGNSYINLSTQQSEYLLNLQTFEDGIIHGILIETKSGMTLYLNGKCIDPSCHRMELFSTNTSNWNYKKLIIEKSDSSLYELIDADHTAVFIMRNNLDFTCLAANSMDHKVRVVFPNLEHRSYQKWIRELIQNWFARPASTAKTNSLTNDKVNFDIAWINTQIISGSFFWNDGESNKLVRYPINYNLKSGEVVQVVDLFEKNSDYKSFIKKYIDSTRTVLGKDFKKNKKDFLLSDAFNYWNILPTGLCFYSEQHPIFGTYRILIPYERLEGRLRKNSFVRKLI